MNNKQLAEMIKTLRKEKMLEQMPGGSPKFKGRARFQGGNQDRNPQSYTSEENKKEVELGTTDTGQAGETVTSNPTDNTASATGSMNKNTNTKEIKEKKNATMG